jgi:hypothetical protein
MEDAKSAHEKVDAQEAREGQKEGAQEAREEEVAHGAEEDSG